jgi:hypothetical protein
VRHVQVAAEHHGLCPFQPLDERQKIHVPALPVIQAGESVLGIGGIDVDQVKIAVLECNDTAFGVVVFDAHPV